MTIPLTEVIFLELDTTRALPQHNDLFYFSFYDSVNALQVSWTMAGDVTAIARLLTDWATAS